MSKNVKVVLNYKGIRELLKGSEMQGCVEGLAEEIKTRAGGGEGYEVTTQQYQTRCTAKVVATTFEAINHEKKNNTLLKSLR